MCAVVRFEQSQTKTLFVLLQVLFTLSVSFTVLSQLPIILHFWLMKACYVRNFAQKKAGKSRVCVRSPLRYLTFYVRLTYINVSLIQSGF